MKNYLYLLILCPCMVFSRTKEIPQVPSSIEIAGIKLKITSEAQREIQKDINSLHASEKYYLIKLDRANLYFPIIERIFKEEGVPDDIKFLSLQESALISDAVSSAQAVGFWQFKDFTGREVGLRIDKYVDERKNIVSASRGAAKYFKRNNFFVKNWIYAVNAYLTGPGGVKAYVDERNFGSDRLTIDKDTHWYVKRFIAHVIAFKEDVGKPHSDGLRLSEYTKGQNKELEEVARLYKVEDETVREYNKWLLKGKIPDDKVYTVVVPVKGKAPVIREKEDPPSQPVVKNTGEEADGISYPDQLKDDLADRNAPVLFEMNGLDAFIAGPKDNIKSVAEKLNLRERRLTRINDLSESATLRSGQVYYIQRKKNKSAIRYHVVQPEESLWAVAQEYGIKVKKLARKNRIAVDEKVKPGLVLWLRKRRPSDVPPEYRPVKPRPVPKAEVANQPEKIDKKTEPKSVSTSSVVVSKEKTHEVTPAKSPSMGASGSRSSRDDKPSTEPNGEHKVLPGESLWTIAQKYGLTIESLQTWNPSMVSSALQPGDLLRLMPGEENQVKEGENLPQTRGKVDETEQPQTEVHSVEPDETLYSISRKYGMTVEALLTVNGLDVNDPIRPGQQLKVVKAAPEPAKEEKEPTGSKVHKVEAGDSLYKLAKKYNTTIEDLMQWNKRETTTLSIDEVLIVSDPGQSE